MRVASVTRRVAESDVEYLTAAATTRAVAMAGRAQQLIIVDQSPLPRVLAQALLEARHARPHLKVVVVTDPRGEVAGGTPVHYLSTLEAAGVIVTRVHLGRLRDPSPLYSSLWRLGFGWWDNPYEDPPGVMTLKMRLRQRNQKRDARQLIVADDGAGGWLSVVATGDSGMAVAMRGGVARDIASGELEVARWSGDDDRLPLPPPTDARGLGAVDVRWLTESAVRNAVLDAIESAGHGDQISVRLGELGDRRIVRALEVAARRTSVRVLLDPQSTVNRVVAGELQRVRGALQVRWSAGTQGSVVYVTHQADLWMCVGSTALTRPDSGDFNLTGNVELRLPQRAAMARAAIADFDAAWTAATGVERYAEHSTLKYWRYRVNEAVGLGGE